MVRINLLPVRQYRRRRLLIGRLRTGAIVLVVALVAVGVLYGGKKREQIRLQADVAAAQQELDRLAAEDVTNKAKEHKRIKEELEGKLGVIASLKAAQKAPVHLLDDLSRTLPEHVWLTSISEGNGEILIDGFAFTNLQVARYMENLEDSAFLEGVELLSAAVTAEADQPVVRFSFRMNEAFPHVKKKAEPAQPAAEAPEAQRAPADGEG